MKKYLTKRNIYIAVFVILYLLVGLVSLFHSFAFFGLANNQGMSIMLGCCFEVGQVMVLMSLLTSKKDRSKIMPYFLMGIMTLVQIIGNIFSSYKYMMTHSVADLEYFKKPIFIWTDLPNDMTTVIVTYIVGAILPIIACSMAAMVSNYIEDTDPKDNVNLIEDHHNEHPELEMSKKESEDFDKAIDNILDANDNIDKDPLEDIEPIKKEEPIKEDYNEQEENESEVIDETKQESNDKGDDGISETDDRGNERVQEDVKGTDEDDTQKINQKTKPHFLNI